MDHQNLEMNCYIEPRLYTVVVSLYWSKKVNLIYQLLKIRTTNSVGLQFGDLGAGNIIAKFKN